MRMKSKFLATVALSAFSMLSFASSDDIVGKWRTVDDKTGFSKAYIQITKNDQGIYMGKIAEIIPRPGYVPLDICRKCTGELKNQPLMGMAVLRDLHQSTKNPRVYEGGKITDPNNGKTYHGKATLSEDGRRLTLRGYVGFERLGRNQTWFRED